MNQQISFAALQVQDVRTSEPLGTPLFFHPHLCIKSNVSKGTSNKKGARTGSKFLKIWHQHFWFIWSMMVMMNSTLLRIQTLFSSQPFEKSHLCRFSVSSVSSRRRSDDRKCCLTKFLEVCGLYSIKLCFVRRHCVTRAFLLSNERNRLSLYDMNFMWNFHEPFYNLNRIDRMPTRKVQFFNSNLSSNQRCGVWAVESSTWTILIPDRHWSTQNHRTCVVFLRNRLVCCSY